MIKKQKIMIVDDEPLNIRVLGNLLSSEYQIIAVTDSREVMTIIWAEDKPDLILLDIVMPLLNGYEVCRNLKSDDRTKDIPVIFITAKDSEVDEVLGFQLGAADYISKPFHPEIVTARIKVQLELKKYQDLLQNQAFIDGLTGVANRRKFDEFIEESYMRISRNKSSLGLVMLDVDFFKSYNDHYGHQKGDDCLKAVAKTITSSALRAGDVVARYGGEEFAIILNDTSRDGVVEVLTKIKSNMEKLAIPHETSECSEYVTLSMGAAIVDGSNGSGTEALIALADAELYTAKQSGRNCYYIFEYPK